MIFRTPPMNLFASLIAVLLVAGCAATVDYRGKYPEPEDMAKLKPGIQREEDVLSVIGSPSNTSTYGDKKWFYVYKKTETQSFLTPKVLEEKVLTLSFSKDGILQDVVETTPDGKAYHPVDYKTPTQGQDRPFLQQVFSNFGRVAKKSPTK